MSDCAAGTTCVSKACVPYKRVFVTSSEHDGNLGGLAGADAICQGRAQAAGLPGTYMAWLTDTKQSPLTRFTQFSGPYALVNGSKIANDWKDLTDNVNGAGVLRDETGAFAGMILGWTGMSSTSFAAKDVCKDWGSKDPTDQGTALYTTWGQSLSQACNLKSRLYCVEQ